MIHRANVNQRAGSPAEPRPSDIDHVLIWDDVSENVRAVAARAAAGGIGHMAEAVEYGTAFSSYWIGRAGIRTWVDVAQAVESPWPEGLAKVQAMLDELDRANLRTPESIRRTPTWTPDEGDFDFDRFSDGEDAFRGVRRRQVAGQQFVTILVQIGANCHTGADSMLWRGAAAIAMARIIEEQGYSAEIMAFSYSRGAFASRRNLLDAVWLKRAHQYLDVGGLTNAVSSWYFRTVMFANFGMVAGQVPEAHLGSERPLPAHLVPHLTPDPAYWLVENVWSKADAIQLVNTRIDSLRVGFSEQVAA